MLKEILKEFFKTLFIFRRKYSPTILRRFCFMLVSIIFALIAIHISNSHIFNVSNIPIYIVLGFMVFFTFFYKVTILIFIISAFTSVGVHYTATNSIIAKTEISMISTYGSDTVQKSVSIACRVLHSKYP